MMKTISLLIAGVLLVSVVSSYPDRLFKRNAERISQKKCREYKDLTSFYHEKNVCRSWQAPCFQKVKEYKCETSTGLIVGGEKAKLGEFPHMAAIGWKSSNGEIGFGCGGSLISEKFILTVAHCSKDRSGEPPQIARLGAHNLGGLGNRTQLVDYKISKFIKHENYNSQSKRHDIGLVELVNSVQFSKFIRPACLGQLSVVSSKVIATGWGKIGTFSSTSDDLLKVSLETIPNTNCMDKRSDEDEDLFDEQICAGSKGKDTCQGDSGGPIQISHDDVNCVFDIVALTSYGSFYCGSALPSVYTRILPYIDWIERKVWKNNV